MPSPGRDRSRSGRAREGAHGRGGARGEHERERARRRDERDRLHGCAPVPVPARGLRGLPRRALAWARALLAKLKDDDILTQSAGIAYYLIFSIFPLALIFLAILGFLPVHDLDRHLMDLLARVLPGPLVDLLRDHVLSLVQTRRTGLFTLGTVLATWSASAATRATIRSLNRTFGVRETRRWYVVQLRAIGITIGLAVLLVAALALLAFGPAIGQRIAVAAGVGHLVAPFWGVARWTLTFAVASLGAAALYYCGPDAHQDFRWLTVGSLAFTAIWVAASLGLAAFVRTRPFDEAYGVLAGFMLLLVWFYLTGLSFLLGGALNAEIAAARQRRDVAGRPGHR